MPPDIPVYEFPAGDGWPIANLLKQVNLVKSTSEAFRMIKQGAVRVDGEKISDRGLILKAGEFHIYQVGKRKFARIMLSGGNGA